MKMPRFATRQIPAILLLALAAGTASAQGAAPAVPEVSLTVSAYRVEGTNPLTAEQTAAILQPFLGEHHGIAGIEAAADALEQALKEAGYSFHRVSVPPQTPDGGVVALRIVHFTVGEVAVKGNQFFSREEVLATLPGLTPGESPDMETLGRALALANEHPAHFYGLTMKEGSAPDTVDAEIRVSDADPDQGYLSFSNTGNRQTGESRLTAGYQWGNLWGLDHVVSASYTTSPEKLDQVRQYGLNYRIPFYALGGSLSAFYVNSDVDAGRVADTFDVNGRGEFMGLSYVHLLDRIGDYSQRLTVSIEDKLFDNRVTALGTPLGAPPYRTRPLTLRYNGRLDALWGGLGFYLEAATNLRGGAHNTEQATVANRQDAVRRFRILRYGIDMSVALAPDWTLTTRLRGQDSRRAVVQGEQFGIGGANSVRGLTEREFAGDRGQTLSFELATPKPLEDLQPIVFVDLGQAKNIVTAVGERGAESVATIGAGLRWTPQRNLSVKLDAGHVLYGVTGGTDKYNFRGHLSVVYRF